jgi:predicted phage terminase large subunit-like protein
MTDISPKEYRAILRSDFYAFTHRSALELHPSMAFQPNWHLEVMSQKLDAVRRGEIKRLIITIPPRHLKSICGSVCLPAYFLGHDPTTQIICASYGQDLADKLARDCRSIMTAPFYRDIFGTRLRQTTLHDFATKEGGFRMATSVGGVLTGRGADVIIIDDPLKPDEAISDVSRNAVNQWYDNSLRSRLNSKQDGCIVIIMQRLHEDDLVGHVLRQEDWDVISFPSIAEKDETHQFETIYGRFSHHRRVGDILHPEREPREIIDGLRRSMGEYNFAGQYQQSPAPLGGGMVKEEWFKRYADRDLPQSFDQIIQSWDTANKPTELADYSVCTTWGVKNKRLYLLHVIRERLAYPDLKRAVRRQSDAWSPSVILIEDKASGTQLIQELTEDGVRNVQRVKPERDKIMRMHAQTAAIENGFVYVPLEAHWLAGYIHELTTFPRGKYDDQVDSTSQALGWLKAPMPHFGLFELYRRQSLALTEPQTVLVRLLSPQNCSHVFTITGRQILIPADRIIQVSEEEARPLLGAGFTSADLD